MYYFLFITLKNILSLAFTFQGFKRILQHFKFVNWWFRFFDVTNRLLVHENLSRVPEYKISPNNSLGGKISGKTNKSVRLSFCTEHFFRRHYLYWILINTTLLPILSSVAFHWLSIFYSSRKSIWYTYLDHRIQQPIPKLRDLFLNLLTNHIWRNNQ